MVLLTMLIILHLYKNNQDIQKHYNAQKYLENRQSH